MFSCVTEIIKGKNKEKDYILLVNGTPAKSYTPLYSPVVIEAIEPKLFKMKGRF